MLHSFVKQVTALEKQLGKKHLNRRSALSAENPKLSARSWKWTHKISRTEQVMTSVSNRLKDEPKKLATPSAYIRMPISKMKALRNRNSA